MRQVRTRSHNVVIATLGSRSPLVEDQSEVRKILDCGQLSPQRLSKLAALDQAEVPTLNHLLSDRDPRIRSQAAAALEHMSETHDLASSVDPLILALNDPVFRVRVIALRAIGKIKSARAVDPIIGLVDNPGSTIPHEKSRIRDAAASALRQIASADPANVSTLASKLPVSSVNVRRAITYGLIRSSGASEVLISLMDTDPDPAVRRFAAGSESILGNIAAIPALVKASTDKNEDVRLAAVRSLGSIDDDVALDALFAATADDSLDVSNSAVHSIGQIGRERAIPFLLGLLGGEDLRDSVLYSFEQMTEKHPDYDWSAVLVALAPLQSLYSSSEHESYRCTRVRHHVVSIFGNIGSEAAVELLTKVSVNDENLRKDAFLRVLGIAQKHPDYDLGSATSLLMSGYSRYWGRDISAEGLILKIAKRNYEIVVAELSRYGLDSGGPMERLARAVRREAQIPGLLTALDAADQATRPALLESLTRLGIAHPSEVVPAIMEKLGQLLVGNEERKQ